MSTEYAPVPTSLCKICQLNPEDFSIPTCEHHFCLACLKSYLLIKITEGDVLTIPCPEIDCPTSISSELIRSLLPDQSARYLLFISKKQKELNPNFRWCPYINCSGFDEKVESNQLKCNQCELEFCYVCTEAWHEGPCKEVQIEGFKRCPKCSVVIEKNFGCLDIKCTVCGFKFCWLCGQDSHKHEVLKCILASKDNWFYWVFSVLLMLYPVLLVFFITVFIVLGIYSEDGVDIFRRNRVAFISGLVFGTLISPALLPLLAVMGLIACPIPFMIGFIRRFSTASNMKLFILLCFLPFYYILLDIGFVLMFILSLALVPTYGIFLFIYKLVLLCY